MMNVNTISFLLLNEKEKLSYFDSHNYKMHLKIIKF